MRRPSEIDRGQRKGPAVARRPFPLKFEICSRRSYFFFFATFFFAVFLAAFFFVAIVPLSYPRLSVEPHPGAAGSRSGTISRSRPNI